MFFSHRLNECKKIFGWKDTRGYDLFLADWVPPFLGGPESFPILSIFGAENLDPDTSSISSVQVACAMILKSVAGPSERFTRHVQTGKYGRYLHKAEKDHVAEFLALPEILAEMLNERKDLFERPRAIFKVGKSPVQKVRTPSMHKERMKS